MSFSTLIFVLQLYVVKKFERWFKFTQLASPFNLWPLNCYSSDVKGAGPQPLCSKTGAGSEAGSRDYRQFQHRHTYVYGSSMQQSHLNAYGLEQAENPSLNNGSLSVVGQLLCSKKGLVDW